MALVILINPKLGKNRKPYRERKAPREPMSILALASYLKNKKPELNVQLIDAVLYEEKYIEQKISDAIAKEEKPILVGFSVMTMQISHATELSDFVKSLYRSVPVVWGGVHPTLFPKETSLDDSVDIAVHGMGEKPLLDICERLMNKQEIHDDIPGTCVNGKLNLLNRPLSMDEYPHIDYDLLDLEHYLGPAYHHEEISLEPNRSLHVLSARGCPWRCAYCINAVARNRWLAMSPDRFLDELSEIIRKFKLEAYRLLDDDFFVSKKRTFAIVEGLKKRGITINWGAQIRANYFRDDYVTLEFAKELRYTGCKALFLGAESGNQRVLDLITKDIKVEQIIHSAEVCNEAGITPVYSWMAGIPSQTEKEILDTIDVMIEISRICPSSVHYPLWNFRPFPGGSLYNRCIKSGLRVPKTLRAWCETGADEDANTGFYSPDNLPWIKNPEFIEYIISRAHEIPYLMNGDFKSRMKGRVTYSNIRNWNTFIHRTNLALSGLYSSFKKISVRA